LILQFLKVLDPAVEQLVKVGQQISYPASKGISVMTQDLVKLRQNVCTLNSSQCDHAEDDKKFNETLVAQVGNFKKATTTIDEALKLVASAGKDTFPILGDFGSILNTIVDIFAIHFEIIATAITKIFIEKTSIEKVLSTTGTPEKFKEAVEKMQSHICKVIESTVTSLNKKEPDVERKATKAFEKYPHLGVELIRFVGKLPGFDLDGLETFRQELGNQSRNMGAGDGNFITMFRTAIKEAAFIAMEFSQGQILSALNKALRETVKKVVIQKLQEEVISQCLQLAQPISDAIPSILKDMGFDLPTLVTDSVTEKVGSSMLTIMDSAEVSILEDLKNNKEKTTQNPE